jgi:hypothetical protein
MSIYTAKNLKCDGLDCREEAEGFLSAKEARWLAAERGWTRAGKLDLCQKCSARRSGWGAEMAVAPALFADAYEVYDKGAECPVEEARSLNSPRYATIQELEARFAMALEQIEDIKRQLPPEVR